MTAANAAGTAKAVSAQPGSAGANPFSTVNVSPFLWCAPRRPRIFFSRPAAIRAFWPRVFSRRRRRRAPAREDHAPSRAQCRPRATRVGACTRLRRQTRDPAAPDAFPPPRVSTSSLPLPGREIFFSPEPRAPIDHVAHLPPRTLPQPRRKTWNLVSDESSDHIISWTADGRTFTVWNPDLMEREQLPNTFKHSNFASFVRQLNNYGFRKCHSDRFEFGVEGFERGKPELLVTLKRHDTPRSKKNTDKGKAAAAASRGKGRDTGGKGVPGGGAQSLELGAYGGITSEVEQLKRDRLLLLKEVMRLREEQSSTADEVRRLSARLQSTEQFQQQMMSFVQAAQDAGGNLANISFDAFANSMGADGMRRGVPRKRRQMFLPSVPHNLDPNAPAVGAASAADAGARPGPDRLAGVGAVTAPAASLREIDEMMPDLEGPDETQTDPDDALTHQMYGPLSPNPNAAIRLPENETGWLDGVDFLRGDADAAGDPFAGKSRGAVIRSMLRDDVANAEGEDARGLVGGAPDAFVSSILERGPSLEKQLSLGFLDGMSSAEIGDLVRDMQIGQEGDEISQRLETLRGAEAR